MSNTSAVKEHQVDLEDRIQLTNQLKEQIVLLDRRCSLLTSEEQELREILEQTDRGRKMAEHELVELSERVNLLATQAALMAEELKKEHDSSNMIERIKRNMVSTVRDLQTELLMEQKRSEEYQKGVRRFEKKVKELTYQSEEDRKTLLRMQELIDKLQTKVKSYKRQADNAVSL
ncbi:hypothetical protein F7725_001219 [Dissostichus mawsoni]|uniref:Uncharacterized protein n=1 Tax=Dissostichus mawsoni TaxID=36200 RepID=A0A7J5ZGM1_DISMA|nr:hypothetical protein F7725_001219 [Dissostichus mawsoni]